jgi:X-Pro dipeptidyl-peptidase
MAESQDRITGDYNDFWAGRDYLNQLDDLKCAVLMAHAFNDWNVMPEHSVRIYEAVKEKGVPCMAYFHQGGHGGPPPLDMMNRWFSRYVCGVENGVEELPRSWVVREGDRRNKPTAYPQYPHPEAAGVTLHPSGEGGGSGDLSGRRGRGKQTLVDDVSKDGAFLAAAGESSHRLLFQTAELTAPVHLSGYAEVSLRVASSKPAANLSVWVVSLPWTETRDINANIITRGWADPQNRNDPRTSSPLEPGEFVDLRFQLQPDDQVIPAGQRIGLMVFSSDRDFTLWPAPGTELTLDLAGCSLTLPVVGGSKALQAAGVR